MTVLHKPVYIPSIESCDIYNNNFRNKELKIKYVGMLPSSLELNKLISIGLKTTVKKESSKLISSDVINLKFKQKVSSGKDIVKILTQKIHKNKNINPEYIEKLESLIAKIEKEDKDDKWNEYSSEQLRHMFYTKGFIFNGIKYVVYKRSSAKSRIGQCLFIKESLHKKMIKWSRMGLNFNSKKAKDVDFPSLLAYESLVGSSLEDVIKIDPKNILIISDVESVFKISANAIRTGSNGYLDSFIEECTVKNSLFDGESLLDQRYFKDGKSMKLLRNHMFKSAAFNCNIQDFLRENCPEGINYKDWKIPSMFEGVSILASNVHLIITPSSLKALKFSNLLGGEVQMWNHWKSVVIKDGCMFGVCKNEKETKRNFSEEEKPIQQTSYQMLNSLPFKRHDINSLLKLEKLFIHKLKNDDSFFMSHIESTANTINSNEMFVELYKTNKKVVNTRSFRKFRRELIASHVSHIKNGKVRLKGDYCVLLGNPMEFLYHSIGKLDTCTPKSLFLHGNEVHTRLFQNKEIVGFRNPHTSPSNVLVSKNVNCAEINRYFNLSKNIVCVNAIDFPIQDILSGSDYDSDTVLLIDDEDLLRIAKSIDNQYRVCVNQVESSKKKYLIDNSNMAKIDNELSKSQRFIGRTVNIGQLCMSRYWHLLNSTKDPNVTDLLKKINVVTVLSGICIDLAKKMFDIDINKEIKYISDSEDLIKEKPLFWQFVSQNDRIISTMYECPMDFLYLEMENIEPASYKKSIDIFDIVNDYSKSNVDRKQEKKIFEYVETMCNKINKTFLESLTDDEKWEQIDNIIKYYKFYVSKLTISEDTMSSLINKITTDTGSRIAIRLLNILFLSSKESFLSVFRPKTPQT